MKKTIKIIFALTLILSVSLSSFACSKKNDGESDEEIDICAEEVRAYLNAKTADEQYSALAYAKGSILDRQYANIEYASEDGKTYRIFVFDADDETESFVLKGRGGKTEGGLFIPGRTYRCKVVGKSSYDEEFVSATEWKDEYAEYVTEEKIVKIKDSPVRYITMHSGYNYRDVGGWKTEDGRRISYGKIYRGARTNEFSDKDILTLKKYLKIRSEIDLRNASDDGGQNSSILGDEVEYLKSPISQYSLIVPSYSAGNRKYDEKSPEEIKRIFEFLADEDNYPLFFHCNAGADRTGTVAFLLLGSLGVGIEDLTRDYELTSFSKGGVRLRGEFKLPFIYGIMQDDGGNFVAWGDLIERICLDYAAADGKLSSAICNYLLSVCGVKAETIDKIRSIMLVK